MCVFIILVRFYVFLSPFLFLGNKRSVERIEMKKPKIAQKGMIPIQISRYQHGLTVPHDMARVSPF